MQTLTVARNDEIYEAFADVAQAADGTLVCTYRESMGHSSRPFSRVIVRRSVDRGLTWGPRQVVIERSAEETARGLGRLNCSRIAACADGTLLLLVDLLLRETFEEYLEPGTCMNLLMRSHDGGATWEGPEETGMTEGMMDNDELLDKFRERIPSGRPGEPEEIAAVIAFLASKDAVWVNGVNLPVNGGLSASNGQPPLG